MGKPAKVAAVFQSLAFALNVEQLATIFSYEVEDS
jgi:hypothetical protein